MNCSINLKMAGRRRLNNLSSALTTKFVFEFRTLMDMSHELELLLELKDIRFTGEVEKGEVDVISF